MPRTPRWEKRIQTGGRKHFRREWFARALRCPDCDKAIILTYRSPSMTLIAVNADSWDGSIFYIKGKHRTHASCCRIVVAKHANRRENHERFWAFEADPPEDFEDSP